MSTRVFLWLGQVHLLPDLNAILCTPSCFCRHPSIRTRCERSIARCKLGVLDSAGAATWSVRSELRLEGKLHRSRSADLVQRIQTAALAAAAEIVVRQQVACLDIEEAHIVGFLNVGVVADVEGIRSRRRLW